MRFPFPANGPFRSFMISYPSSRAPCSPEDVIAAATSFVTRCDKSGTTVMRRPAPRSSHRHPDKPWLP
eukprot:6486782-Amphidinium_carterae.1